MIILPVIGIVVGMLMITGSAVYLTTETIMGGSGEGSLLIMVVGLIIYIAALIWCMVRR